MKNADMLVKLYDIDQNRADDDIRRPGIEIRLARAIEKQTVLDWVGKHFSQGWVSEAAIAFDASPPSGVIALHDSQVIGFCCYDTSALGFCGPIGVDPAFQQRGVGRALLLATLLEMKAKGYGYAIIGWVRETQFKFYEKTVGATEIPNSFPGVYRSRLNNN